MCNSVLFRLLFNRQILFEYLTSEITRDSLLLLPDHLSRPNQYARGLESPCVVAVCGALSQCCPGACRAFCAGAHSMVLRPLFDAAGTNFSARTDSIHCNRSTKVHLLYRCVLKHRTCAHEGKNDATMLHTGRPTWSATPQKLPRDALNAGKHCCCG